jgi:hypothetical protein
VFEERVKALCGLEAPALSDRMTGMVYLIRTALSSETDRSNIHQVQLPNSIKLKKV